MLMKLTPVEKKALESNPLPCESQPKPRPEMKKFEEIFLYLKVINIKVNYNLPDLCQLA